MEQIEAGKRKTSKDRQKWSTSSTVSKRSTSSSVSRSEEKEINDDAKNYSRRREKVDENQKSKPKKNTSRYKLDKQLKNNNHNSPSNDSATTSAMTSPITDYLPPCSSTNLPTSIDIIASEYHSGLKTVVSEPDGISQTRCRRSSANVLNKYDDNSWDCMNDIERKPIDHQNEYSYKKMSYPGSSANVVIHTPTDGLIFGEHNENDELVPPQLADEMSGKFTNNSIFIEDHFVHVKHIVRNYSFTECQMFSMARYLILS